MERGRALLAALALLASGPVLAGTGGDAKPFSAAGYLKELWQYSHSPLDGRPYFLSTSRARLTLDAKASAFKVHADYDHEVLAGSFFRTQDFRFFGLAEPQSWLTMEQTISTGDTTIWRHRLYRGWAALESERGLARFGRQRIAWGTGKLWNPTDVLNPYQPTTLERDERRGVDAFYARWALGDLSQAELAWAPEDRFPDHAVLGRLRANWKGYDASVMGGKIAPSTASWMAGGDFAGNLWEGSLHGEWSYTDPKIRAPFWKAGLGYDYTFPADARLQPLRDASVVVEYFHSGSGALNPARYDFAKLLGGREVTLAQDYAGLTYAKDAHPLLKVELSAIANLNDRSHFVSPSLQYNALQNLYLTAGFQRFGGGRRTELGRQPNIFFLQGQYYF